MFNMDPKSAAIKNAMAKRRYNTVFTILLLFEFASNISFRLENNENLVRCNSYCMEQDYLAIYQD